jgi:Protein of unknown function (DUF1761)
MPGINIWAVVVAAVAAFVASSVWYILFGKERMKLLRNDPAASADMKKSPAWKKPVELVRGLIVAYVLARFVVLLGVADWKAAAQLGFWLWIGFPAMILAGSVLWDNRPGKLAAIHAGDWLIKLLLMTVILAVWR